MCAQQALSTNTFTAATWIVNSDITKGTHTTLAGALTSASSGDTILLQTSVTENVTLKAGVNIVALLGAEQTPNVSITGKCTMTTAGTVTISGIRLITNSDFFLAVTGSANSVVILENCYLNASNNTGISYTTTGTSSAIRCRYCFGDIGTTAIAMFDHSASGSLSFRYCDISNSGSTSTANTLSGVGGLQFFYSVIANPITSSGTTATFDIEYSSISGSTTNTTAITHGSTSATTSTILGSRILGGSASAISVSVNATLSLNNSIVDSSNTNAVTGAGTLTYSNVNFTNTSSVMNTTTQTPHYTNLGKYKASGQPAFSAYKSSTTTNATGNGVAYTVLFDTVVFDLNSNYTSGSGTFTAPVTGKYLLTFSVATSAYTAQNTGTMNIVTTARTYVANTFNWFVLAATTNQVDQTMTVLADMAAGDTATCTVTLFASTQTVSVVGGATWQTGFSGYLVA